MILGVVGKPNVGKSTFFKALTLANVEIANYPFATISPNTGVGHVTVERVDKDFGRESNPREGYCLGDKRFVPVNVIDVAGLVPGAHEGKGMGNQFMDDLNQADALLHVIDVSGSTNEKGEQIKPLSYDPAGDIRFLEKELDMWYMRILEKGWDKTARQIKQTQSKPEISLNKQMSGIGTKEEMIKETLYELELYEKDPTQWSREELYGLCSELRKKTKPIIIAANKIDVPGAEENLRRLKTEFPGYVIIGCSAESELALKEASKNGLIDYIPGENSFSLTEYGDSTLTEEQKKALDFIKSNILDRFGSTGVQEVIDKAIFEVLDYIAIFPGGVNKMEDQHGNVLPDCFLMHNGSTALDFAYKVHTDIGKRFIRAVDARTKMTVGKEHKLKHRDVLEIITAK
ncbi:MAG: redox-regulated ATPase YchF [Candidatus Woesearchaeota archaeon]